MLTEAGSQGQVEKVVFAKTPRRPVGYGAVRGRYSRVQALCLEDHPPCGGNHAGAGNSSP
jgi:hypothetical protein